ncbi:hypothetical protein B0I37DRAFT_86233 [Chaetomium sp. MPI-CAGE-AT-0009]|nr:hypothetical protein B0I37DRAFT_86233 [Chaetomium sp. MPI-CAGE-AT-0009]
MTEDPQRYYETAGLPTNSLSKTYTGSGRAMNRQVKANAVVVPYYSRRLRRPAASDLKTEPVAVVVRHNHSSYRLHLNVRTLSPNPVSQHADSVIDVSDDLRWSGDSFSLDPVNNDMDMESQLSLEPTDLHTQLDVWNGPMPGFHTRQPEKSPVAHNELIGGSDFELILEHSQLTLDRPFASDSPQIESVTPATQIKRHTCDLCGMSFRSTKDVDRHRRSIHEKSTPYVCYETGCRRSGRGFARKTTTKGTGAMPIRNPQSLATPGFLLAGRGRNLT